MTELFSNYIYFSFFDNEDEGDLDAGKNQDPSSEWDQGSLDGQDGDKQTDSNYFTQDDLNRFLAEDRRKHQERYKKLESSYEKMLKEGNLHKEQRHKMQQDLEDLQKAFYKRQNNITCQSQPLPLAIS